MVPFAAYLVYLGYLKLFGNFHAVVPNEAYRSAMLTGAQLRKYHKQNGFRSIINLRGGTAGDPWFDTQNTIVKSLGIEQFDFGISARKPIEKERALALIQLMKDAPKPVLIHCKAGADRTGLASALYLAAIAGQSRETSEREISLWFGHFCVPYVSYSYAIQKNWKAYTTWLWPT